MRGFIIPFGSRSLVSIDKKINLQKNQLATISDIRETDVSVDVSDRAKVLAAVLLTGSLPMDYSKAYEEIAEPDFLFIRYAGADRQFVKFLRRIKEKYSQCKIIVEIPTYPNIKERLLAPVNWLLLPGELLLYRWVIKRYVDRFLIYSDYDCIYGVPTIKTMNGTDVKKVSPKSDGHRDSINIIAVAHMQAYDGYERLIDSLDTYVNNGGMRAVKIYLVGDGPEEERYRSMVKTKGLEDKVFLCGRKTGEELNRLYELADIGVDVLGCYKKGMEISPSLKSKEYLAHGLPMIGACEIDVFLKYDFPYYLKFPNDPSPIDMNDIITFYDRVYKDGTREQVMDSIYEYALDHVDISQTMKPVLDYIQKACNSESK
ncbi:MAG: glycosyltransferase family 4 protein [Lachnospiraceae bacterium]|nr:glycosyltransferase family 4 protein [Lachnospiraceae bacterium]